jgi:hypothetical protein
MERRVDVSDRIQVLLWFIIVALEVFTSSPCAWRGKRHRRSKRSKPPPPRGLPHSDYYDGFARADYDHVLTVAICQLSQPRPYFGRRQSL